MQTERTEVEKIPTDAITKIHEYIKSTKVDFTYNKLFDFGKYCYCLPKEEVPEKFLLHLIDITWNECAGDNSVPSTKWAKEIIEEAKVTYSAEKINVKSEVPEKTEIIKCDTCEKEFEIPEKDIKEVNQCEPCLLGLKEEVPEITVYVPVKCSERLPEGKVKASFKGNEGTLQIYEIGASFISHGHCEKFSFSEDELYQIIWLNPVPLKSLLK